MPASRTFARCDAIASHAFIVSAGYLNQDP
jgi:hypothetical protein